MRHPRHRTLSSLVGAAGAVVGGVCLLAPPLSAAAAGGATPTTTVAAAAVTALTVTTPYPAIDTEPGSTVRLTLAVQAPQPEPVDLTVDGIPDGWTATLRGGGFVIHSVTATPDEPSQVTLEIDVAADAAPGDYPITITGTSGSGSGAETAQADVTLTIAEQVDNGIQVTADFPSLKGAADSDFTYNLTIANNTPEDQTFTFDPTGPEGWTVTASPTAEARAETVTIDAGGTGQVKVTASPPDSAEQGDYTIDVSVVAANGATGDISLTAEVTGSPQLVLGTADQRLDVSGPSDHEHRVPLIVANSGSAPLEDVKLAATAPSGWDVSFDPQTITEVKPNETAQVTAIVKPSSSAVAGDYSITVRASAGSNSQSIELRYTLKGSRTLGYVAIGVIAAAVLALVGVFVRFGRR